MLMKELAAALGISAAMVSKLAKRGMPTDSFERALRWRRRNLEPGRVKGQRAGTDAGAGQADAAGLLADRDQAAAGGDCVEGDIEDDVQHPVSGLLPVP